MDTSVKHLPNSPFSAGGKSLSKRLFATSIRLMTLLRTDGSTLLSAVGSIASGQLFASVVCQVESLSSMSRPSRQDATLVRVNDVILLFSEKHPISAARFSSGKPLSR